MVIAAERHTTAKPTAVIVQIRHSRLDHTAIHPRRRHIALQKQTDAGAAVECPACNVAGIGIWAVVDGRVGDGPAGDDFGVAQVEGVPEGADEVDGDGDTGVDGVAEGDVATAVDAQGHGEGKRSGEEEGDDDGGEPQQGRDQRCMHADGTNSRRMGIRHLGTLKHQAGRIG